MDKKISDLLRRAIRECGLSLLAISKLTGVPQPRISVFMSGKDIRLATAQKLADYFGLRMCEKK